MTKLDQRELKWIKVDKIDRIRPKWTKYNQCESNRANVD